MTPSRPTDVWSNIIQLDDVGCLKVRGLTTCFWRNTCSLSYLDSPPKSSVFVETVDIHEAACNVQSVVWF